MRGKRAPKREIAPDKMYKSTEVAKFINRVMEHGKKSVAEKIFYTSLSEAAKTLHEEPLTVFEKAIKTVSPAVEVRSRRVGGATYQVPMPVDERRQIALASRWIIGSARKRKGDAMIARLSQELVDAYNATGNAYKKKEDVERMAEANKAFSHFASVSTS